LGEDESGLALSGDALEIISKENELVSEQVTAGRFGGSVTITSDSDMVLEVYPPYSPIGEDASYIHLPPGSSMTVSAGPNQKLCRLIVG
jgi:hypothetical protein